MWGTWCQTWTGVVCALLSTSFEFGVVKFFRCKFLLLLCTSVCSCLQATCSIFGCFLKPYTPGLGYPPMGPRPNTPRGFHQLWLFTRTPIPCSPPHGTRVFYYTDCACAVFAFAGGRATHLGHARSGAALPEGHVTVHIFCSFCSKSFC